MAAVFSPALTRVLNEVDDALLALAEGGLAALNPLRIDRVRQAAPQTERMGLQALKTGLENTANDCLFVWRTAPNSQSAPASVTVNGRIRPQWAPQLRSGFRSIGKRASRASRTGSVFAWMRPSAQRPQLLAHQSPRLPARRPRLSLAAPPAQIDATSSLCRARRASSGRSPKQEMP